MYAEVDEEFIDQNISDGLEDVEVIVSKEKQNQLELQQVYIKKEIEYKQLRMELQEILDKIHQLRMKEYDDNLPLVDPYLREYVKELEEQLLGDLESQRQEIKGEKQVLIDSWKQLQTGRTQIKYFFSSTEIQSQLQISYKNMLENLNQELFQYMQERADLEDEQFEFDKRLKSLRAQIRQVTEKNQKLIQQIENSKQVE